MTYKLYFLNKKSIQKFFQEEKISMYDFIQTLNKLLLCPVPLQFTYPHVYFGSNLYSTIDNLDLQIIYPQVISQGGWEYVQM